MRRSQRGACPRQPKSLNYWETGYRRPLDEGRGLTSCHSGYHFPKAFLANFQKTLPVALTVSQISSTKNDSDTSKKGVKMVKFDRIGCGNGADNVLACHRRLSQVSARKPVSIAFVDVIPGLSKAILRISSRASKEFSYVDEKSRVLFTQLSGMSLFTIGTVDLLMVKGSMMNIGPGQVYRILNLSNHFIEFDVTVVLVD